MADVRSRAADAVAPVAVQAAAVRALAVLPVAVAAQPVAAKRSEQPPEKFNLIPRGIDP
jgi:hypothetical protein